MTKGASSERALASDVDLRSVHAYLQASGWVRDSRPGSDTVDIYLSPKDDQESAIVPVSKNFPDYGLRVYQLAEQLAQIEERPLRAVLIDLALADLDLVRLRLTGVDENGAVKLTDGATALAEARNLLLAAACSADRPQRMYRAGRNNRASEYLDRVRLGHTEPGSYVINILSPVAPSIVEEKDAGPEDPFERRVVRRLVSGLRASREGVDRLDRRVGSIREFEDRLSDGVSANLCRSAARLARAGGGLEVSVSWAMTRPNGRAGEARPTVAFGPSDASVLDEAARVLAGRQERTDEEIHGHVSRLSRGARDRDGAATIKTLIDGRPTSVRAVFEPADYSEIIRAHEARLYVSLEGELIREGQRWRLRNPRGLAVIEDDEEA